VIIGARPSEKMSEPVTRPAMPVSGTRDITTRPIAATTNPAPITNAGRARRVIAGATMEPTMNPPDQGKSHRPADRGVSRRTSCRYYPMNT